MSQEELDALTANLNSPEGASQAQIAEKVAPEPALDKPAAEIETQPPAEKAEEPKSPTKDDYVAAAADIK